VFLHAITDACTPVCLFTAITSVEAVTPPWNDAICDQLNCNTHEQQVNPSKLDASETLMDAVCGHGFGVGINTIQTRNSRLPSATTTSTASHRAST